MKLIFVAAVILMFGESFAEQCPDVPFVKNFEPKRFLGKWRSLMTTGLDMACGGYEVYEGNEIDTFRLHLLPVKIDSKLRLVKPNDFSAGFDEESPIEIFNKGNLRVIATDYTNYAVAVQCKNSDGLFFVSATISSRSGTLSSDIIENLKRLLVSHGVDVSGFKVMRQDIC